MAAIRQLQTVVWKTAQPFPRGVRHEGFLTPALSLRERGRFERMFVFGGSGDKTVAPTGA